MNILIGQIVVYVNEHLAEFPAIIVKVHGVSGPCNLQAFATDYTGHGNAAGNVTFISSVPYAAPGKKAPGKKGAKPNTWHYLEENTPEPEPEVQEAS